MPLALAPYIIGNAAPGDTRANAETYLQQFGPLQDAFTCPSDELTSSRQYNTSPWVETDAGNITGWMSYGYNAEIIAPSGGGSQHRRLYGNGSRVPHPTETMLMMDVRVDGFNVKPEIWNISDNTGTTDPTLGGCYLGYNAFGPGQFDLQRHHGNLNILYVDGHVDSQPILDTGSTTNNGVAKGSPGNSPSGALENVWVWKDFPN